MKNTLKEKYSHLLKEWHPTKNGDLTPEDVSVSSNKNVWWLVAYDDPKTGKHFDFEWKATVVNRTKGAGCPYLTGNTIFCGFNDLATTHPEVAAEWHPTKNGDLMPNMIKAGSNRKVWWLLPYDDPETGKHYDFEWQAAINHRAEGSTCPYLCNKKIWPGFNDLATTHPKVAAEWHPTKNGDLTPDQVPSGTQQKVWWLFPYDDPETGKHFDFEWESTVKSRTEGCLCPFLSGRDTWPGFNDLATKRPDLAAEWHPTKNGDLTPDQVTANSNKKVWWLLSHYDSETGKYFDFEWQAVINNRAAGAECPYFSGHKVHAGFNDLQTTRPFLAAEWDYEKNGKLTPNKVSLGSQKRIWWKCSKGHSWEATIASRSSGRGCPECAKKQRLKYRMRK